MKNSETQSTGGVMRVADGGPGHLETDPSGLSAATPGAKLDHGKEKVSQGVTNYFPRALLAVAEVSEFGAAKYSWGGWAHVDDGINRYRDAHGRHVLKEQIEGKYDKEGLRHAAQIAWNALAVLELELVKEEREQKTGRA